MRHFTCQQETLWTWHHNEQPRCSTLTVISTFYVNVIKNLLNRLYLWHSKSIWGLHNICNLSFPFEKRPKICNPCRSKHTGILSKFWILTAPRWNKKHTTSTLKASPAVSVARRGGAIKRKNTSSQDIFIDSSHLLILLSKQANCNVMYKLRISPKYVSISFKLLLFPFFITSVTLGRYI
jgi:hypothetical protein